MTYELWDLDSGNRIISSDEEALVRRIILDLLQTPGYKLSLDLPDGELLENEPLVCWALDP